MARYCRAALGAAVVICSLGAGAATALAVTPGWECIPKTAGKAVVSGGTGPGPACASGTTPILAPTYVSSGVGGKPTVEFSNVNVQILSGANSTSAPVNGRGNLVVGYDENPGQRTRTGSNNLIVGTNNGWSSFGAILGGSGDVGSAPYTTAFGENDTASGSGALVAGQSNRASGVDSSVTGGRYNLATDKWSSIVGGCDNLAGAGNVPTGPCTNQAESMLGGASNHATGIESTISGGQHNSTTGAIAAISGGLTNYADGVGSVVSGGYANTAGASEASISGGGENTATGDVSSIAGGYYNTATVDEASILGGCSNVAGVGTVTIAPGCSNFGDSFMAIVGGIGNQDVPLGSTILGGESNSISAGQGGAIAGGHAELLSGATHDLTRSGATSFNP